MMRERQFHVWSFVLAEATYMARFTLDRSDQAGQTEPCRTTRACLLCRAQLLRNFDVIVGTSAITLHRLQHKVAAKRLGIHS